MKFTFYKLLILVSVLFFIFISCNSGSSISDTPEPPVFTLRSSKFNDNQRIPDEYCYDKGNMSLPFSWINPPKSVQSYGLVIHDPDGGDWIHWAVFNIPKDLISIDEDISGTNMPLGCV